MRTADSNLAEDCLALLAAVETNVAASLDTIDAALERRSQLADALGVVEGSLFARAHAVCKKVGISRPVAPNLDPAESSEASTWTSIRQARRLLVDIFGNQRSLRATSAPTVSIVIPVFNHARLTYRCLTSIAHSLPPTFSGEIIVVDDASSDQTHALFSKLPVLKYIRATANGGFILTRNLGARVARGRYLCFLNNDTLVRDGWLQFLVEAAEADPMIWAVGSKLVYPDGRLQEAGNIIWSDGSGWNYGWHDDPRDPAYNFSREVDYCSGASLLVRADAFRKLGGFSANLRPAYYEDTDFCFRVRQAGFKVMYEPRSIVVHVGGASSGTNIETGTKRYQEVNRHKFAGHWNGVLRSQLENEPANVYIAARSRCGSRGTIVMIDSYVPLHDRESGSLRLLQIIKMLRRGGYHVVFYPDNLAALQPYTGELQSLGVEVIYYIEGLRDCSERLDEALQHAKLAWVCRPDLYSRYSPRIRRNKNLKLIYDTIDLHFVRLKRRASLEGISADWEEVRDQELACAREADVTITVTEDERQILIDHAINSVSVIPNIHDPRHATCLPFPKTRGLLFIGGYNHPPNVDAVQWLVNVVMQLVWEALPSLSVTLLGSNPPAAVRDLESARVSVPGFIADVDPYFQSHRIFVAPLRYGAGLKGKVGQALSYGIPIITTSIGAEGFNLVKGRDCLCADSAEEFAKAIIELYRNKRLWNLLSRMGPRALAPYSTKNVEHELLQMIRTTVGT